jgi:hypothetical protein
MANNYLDIYKYCQENKNRNWKEWLEFVEVFKKPGKQGLVGLFRLKENKDVKIVFKISQYINYLSKHELIIMNGLNDISSYCLHFCKPYGMINSLIDPNSRKSGNPFKINCKYPIEKEILLCEYIDNSKKLYNYIKNEKVNENNLYSIIKQVLLGVSIAQSKKKFTHYDLHSDNIMIKKCDKDLVFLYILDEDNQFCVSTNGIYPVIIDYGFSYISDMDNEYLWASMAHTDVGFMSDRFDKYADPKLFLVTVSGEIKERRRTSLSKKFNRIVHNLFNPLNIDWLSGWDDVDEQGALYYVLDMIEDYNTDSKFFNDYEHYCIEIIQTLITLPLKEQNYSNIHVSYSSFLKEWIKIENEISSPFYNLYILKCIVDAARVVKLKYININTKSKAISDFKKIIYENINKICKYCQPKNLNYEILLCSLLVYVKCIEGVLYDVITTRILKKEKEYSKLPLQKIEQMYASIEINIPDKYIYNDNTEIMIFDCVNKETRMYKLKEDEIDEINSVPTISRGTYIYNYEKNK